MKILKEREMQLYIKIACETLQSHYYIKPYYVYDYSQETYCLCGLLDCDCYDWECDRIS